MKIIKHILLLCSLLIGTAYAGDGYLYVSKSDNASQTFALDGLRKLTFNNAEMQVVKKTGNANTIAFSVLNYFTLKDGTKTIQHDGKAREYKIVFPPDTPKGILVYLHKMNGSSSDYAYFRNVAAELNYILLSPQALPEQHETEIKNALPSNSTLRNAIIGYLPAFNAIWDCGVTLQKTAITGTLLSFAWSGAYNQTLGKDNQDAGMIDAIIAKTLSDYSLQNRNIFVAGIGMGGCMAYQYALTHNNAVNLSGIISINGSHGGAVTGSSNAVKIPVCDFASTKSAGDVDKEDMPYGGTQIITVPDYGTVTIKKVDSKINVINSWKGSGKNNVSTSTEINIGSVTKTIYTNVSDSPADKYEVAAYSLGDVAHNKVFDTANSDPISFQTEILDFIERHAVVDGSTGLDKAIPFVDNNEPLISIRYYNLNGIELSRPVNNGITIVKKNYASGRTEVVKKVRNEK